MLSVGAGGSAVVPVGKCVYDVYMIQRQCQQNLATSHTQTHGENLNQVQIFYYTAAADDYKG